MVRRGRPKKGHKPPSRIKYEQSHPVIGIRVDSVLYDRLKELKRKSNMSFASLVKQALDALESSVGEAYQRGYAEAEEKYGVTYPCSICGEEIVITRGSKSYEPMRRYMKEHGWGHSECHEDRRKRGS